MDFFNSRNAAKKQSVKIPTLGGVFLKGNFGIRGNCVKNFFMWLAPVLYDFLVDVARAQSYNVERMGPKVPPLRRSRGT